MADDPKEPPKANPIAGSLSGNFGISPGGKSQSKYDVGSPHDELGDLNAVRARNQGFWDGLANTGVNLITTVLGQAIETVGSITDPIYNWFADNELKVNQGLTGAGMELQNQGNTNYPIYYDPKQGFNTDYVLSHIPSLASTLSMLLPGYGVAKGAGMGARALRLGKLGEQIIATGAGAIAMRHAENWMESANLYDQIKKEGAQGTNPAFDGLSYDQIENAAKTAAAVDYKMNWANIGFDILQMAALLKPIKGLTGWTNTLGKESKFAQVMDYGYKAAVEKGLLADASKLGKFGLRSAAFMRPLLIQSTEGVEEAVNYVAEQEGRHAAEVKAGYKQDDGKTVWDRMPEYTHNWQLWDSFIWGVLGGVTFQQGGQMLNRAGAKAGWWEDTTERSQMLADLKNRSDIITKGYRDLADPKLTEYDKEAVKANMLFNLVSSNKSSESLDMLEEDLSNPKMRQVFAQQMGLKEEDVNKELPTLLEDIKYINEKLDQYTGATLSSWAGSPTERITTGIDGPGEQTTTAAAVGPTRAAKLFNKVPFVNDPKIAMLLANNDYRVHVQDRLNTKAVQEMQSILGKTFSNQDKHDVNSQSVFNVMAEIAALEGVVSQEKNDLTTREEKKLPETYIETAKNRMTTSEVALERKKKQLETLKQIMDQNVEDKIPGTTFKEAQNFALEALGRTGVASKYASLKHMYYLNQLDKAEQIQVNKEVLTDPQKFIENSLIAFKADQVYKQQKVAEQETAEQEKKAIGIQIANLVSENNSEFQAAVKRHADAINSSLEKYDTPAAKQQYLQRELTATTNEFNEATARGEFAADSMVEFNTKFNKQLYTDLKAREAALNAAMKPYQNVYSAPGTSVTPTVTTKDPGISRDQFEEGTPGHHLQGMTKMFGKDGKAGSFNSTFINNQVGISGLVKTFETYPGFITGLQDILEKYQKAKQAKDPGARDILYDANQFAQTGRDFTSLTNETQIVEEIQKELEYLNEKLEKADTNLKAIPSESSQWRGIAKGLYPSAYPETYEFAKTLIDSYPNSLAIAEERYDGSPLYQAINTELQKARDNFDEWQKGTIKPIKPEGPISEDQVDKAMDQPLDSQQQNAEFIENDSFTESDNLYPATHAESITEYKETANGWQDTYANGKHLVNPNFSMGNTIFIGKGNKTMNGFVVRGSAVTFTYTGNYRGKNENAEKEIAIHDDKGNLIGFMDTAARLKKVIATLKNKKPNTQKKKDKIARTIAKYNELIPYYNQLRNQFASKGDVISGTVADKISSADGSVQSGGITIGSVITTQREGDSKNSTPISLQSAFGLETINRSNKDVVAPVLLSVYYNGELSVFSPTDSKFKDVAQVHNYVSIPTAARNISTISGKGTNNGAVFAVVPTNTFDQDGKRIHLPFKLATATVTNVNLTSDNTKNGQTLPEAMLDVLTNPDQRRQEFEMLAGRVDIKFKKEFPISDRENRDQLLALFTTDNLLRIFNDVTYVYRGTQETKDKLNRTDWSHHIGIHVFNPASAKSKNLNKPVIRFDLSNDLEVNNTFVIQLFDEEGKFAPSFGRKQITGAQAMNAEQRAATPGATRLETYVDVKSAVNKRFRQKLFRVNKNLISRNSDKSSYKAIVFDGGKLIEKQYDSYLHFLNEKQILESTVHGIDFSATDPKTGTTEKGRSYFTNQSFWFDMSPAKEKPAIAEPSANRKYTGTPPVINKDTATPEGFTNRVFDKNIQLGTAPANAHISEVGYNYRTLSQKEVDSIASSGGVYAREGKQKGGNANTKYWTKGNNINWYGDKESLETIRVKDENFKADEVVSAKNVEVYNKKTGKFESLKVADKPATRTYYSHPDAIVASRELVRDKHIKKVGSGKNSYYSINGERYERVSHILKPPKDSASPALAAGNAVDKFVKEWLADVSPTNTQFSTEAHETLVNHLLSVQDYLASKGQQVVGTDVIVYAKIKGADNITRNIAGEIDLLTVDQHGGLYVYDFKTSKNPFNLASYKAVNKKTGENAYDQHVQQLTAYSDLLKAMTGNPATAIGTLPMTIDYTLDGKDVNINSIVPYEPVIFPEFGFVPATNTRTSFSNTENYENLGELTNDEIEGINLDNNQENIPDMFMTDDVQNLAAQHREESPYSDPSRFRDHTRQYPEQKQYENYTAQMMLDVLYDHRVAKGNYSQLTYEEIAERVRGIIDGKIITYKKIIRDMGIRTATQKISFTDQQVQEKREQMRHMEELKRFLDPSTMTKQEIADSKDFVGYGRMGIIKLSATGIIRTDIIDEDVKVTGPEEMPYSVRFQENYAFKINPKTTISAEAKIFLSRIPQLEIYNTPNGTAFRKNANLFGIDNYYAVDTVITELHTDFENVPPERFMDRLAELDTRIPIIRSAVQVINKIANQDKAGQIRNQLSTLIKQRRDMKFMKVNIDPETGKVKATVIDAARQGITQNIIKTWEDLFRQRFTRLFDVKETEPGNLRNTGLSATPKKQTINYPERGKSYETADFTLPTDFDVNTYKISWQTDFIYNKLKAIAMGTTQKRVSFSFDKERLKIGDYLLAVSQSDIAQMLLSFDSPNIVVDNKLSSLFTGRFVKDTHLEQIAANIDYFLQKRGVFSGNTESKKDVDGYYPIYYKIMADQMARVGLQLSENDSLSWTVLQDLNTPVGSGNRRKFHIYDSRAEGFSNFLTDKVNNLIIAPLIKPNVFNAVEKRFVDEDSADFGYTARKIDAENPFSHSLQGINPFAKHARIEWHSYANETIRNTNGDLEYTYTSANGLSTMLSKMKDPVSGYLQQMAETPMGRYNVFIRNLLNSPNALNDFTLHYVDGGQVNNRDRVVPEDMNAGKANLLLWNLYYNNETKTAQRNKGGYVTTHSDSSIMPVMMFDKQTTAIDFMENIDDNGNRSYQINLKELNTDGSENQTWRHLYGIFRGELQRMYEAYQAWEDISSQPEDRQLEYAVNNYQMHYHFKVRNGKVIRGNAVNMYLFGSTLFEGNNSGVYQDDRKSGLRREFFDDQGDANEGFIKEHFAGFVNTYINELVGDAYSDIIAMGDSFFSINEVQGQKAFDGDTKTTRLQLSLNTLNAESVSAMETQFRTHAGVATNYGRENVQSRDNRIEKSYNEAKLIKDGMTEQEAKEHISRMQQIKDNDIKRATYPELFLKYLVADMSLNNAIFLGSLFQMMLDPAIFEKGATYKGFREDFEKRMKGPVSPGEVSYFADNESVKVVAFADIKNGDIKAEIDETKLTAIQKDFISKFRDKMQITGNLFPTRVFDMMAFQGDKPGEWRWDDIKSMLNTKITDGGSYISTREWLYRLYRQGKITKGDYNEAIGFFYNNNGKRPAPAKVMKYVYGGNNMIDVGNSSANIYSYIKHAETPLLPGIHTGTALDALRQQIEAIEKREYADQINDEPIPGIVAVPESSFKTGFNSNARIFNEDGSLTKDLIDAKVLNLNRGFLREQVQSPDDSDKRSMISSQANVLTDIDIPADFRFGRRGPLTFSTQQEGDKIVEYNEEGDEVEVTDSGTGISSNVLQNSVIQVFTELAERRFQDQIHDMGLERTESEFLINSVSSFVGRIKAQALSRFGVGATSVDYLTVLKENDKETLAIPVSFTPAAKRLQSVFLAELKDIFYRFTLPGGAFSQFSAAGLHTFEKGKIKADSELKSYRVNVRTSKVYASEEEAMKDFGKNEIHTSYNPATKTLEYYEFDPGEAVLPWIFKGKDGKLLDYDRYCNQDGTPKTGMMDDNILHFVAFRIPNTGPNASARLKAVRFMRPEMGDGIAVAPEIVAILGADFDYDKLYSYIYNYEVNERTGKLSRVNSVLHPSQNGQEDFFVSDNQKREYAKRRLMAGNKEYRQLSDDLKAVQSGAIDLERNYSDMVSALGSKKFEDFVKMQQKAIAMAPEELQKQMKIIEDAYLQSEDFSKDYSKAGIFRKQSVAGLENALIDRFNLVLGDYKMLKFMTTPLTSDWLSDQVNEKKIPYYEGAERKTGSIVSQLHDKKYHSITSYNSFLQSRLSNASAGKLIGMGANALISQYQGQRWNLSLNGVAYGDEYQPSYILRFKDRNGNVKGEEDADRYNSTHSGFYSPYSIKYKGEKLYDHPVDGRWRLDRISVKNDKGETTLVSTALRAVLQAALDHQKNPLIDKGFINPITFNAANALIRLGYVDEAIPLLNQQSVFDYVRGISGYYDLEADESRTSVLLRIVTEYATQYGLTPDQIQAAFRGLDKEHKNGAVLINQLMTLIPQVKDGNDILSTNDLLFGITVRSGATLPDAEYGIRQLAALRDYILADIYGRQLFNVQQNTSAYAKGLKSSFAEVDLQDRRFNELYQYQPKANRIKSTAPLIAGLHRINYAWANSIRRGRDFRPTMMSYGQFRGVKPTIQMLGSVEGTVFSEMTKLFKKARRDFYLTSFGIDINQSLKGISNAEYVRTFNKINTNMVSFFFSNPELYRSLFNNQEEFNAFSQYGIEMMTRPHDGLPYSTDFELFNTKESLAKSLETLARKINPSTGNEYDVDYDILAALKPVFNVSYKTPSSVIYVTANGYQDNINHRLAMSVADMFRSPDPELKGMAKKLIIYAFMTGGVTTPSSFVQFLPPSILRSIGFDSTLRRSLDVAQRTQFIDAATKTFLIQYFQHHPFELVKELQPSKDLVFVGSDYLQTDKELGRQVAQINPEKKDWFKNKFIFRIDSSLFVNHPTDENYIMEIDNLGMNKWHRNEYSFNFAKVPGNSLYAHNIAEDSRRITEGIEVKGEMQQQEDIGNADTQRLLKLMETPMFNTVADQPADMPTLVKAIQLDKSNPTAAGVLSFLAPLTKNIVVKYEASEPGRLGVFRGGNTFSINTNSNKFKGLLTGNPKEFDNYVFAETVAHEMTHAVTVQTIQNVLNGKEKDVAKKQAVNRLIELHARVVQALKTDKTLGSHHKEFIRFQGLVAKQAAGTKLTDSDRQFYADHISFLGLEMNAKVDDAATAQLMQIGEFVAYVFTSERLQKDLNAINFKKKRTFWQEIMDVIMRILGLNISEEQAQEEVTDIKKKLTPREPFVNDAGYASTKRGDISDTIRELTPFSALHVALREIIELGVIAKEDALATSAMSEIKTPPMNMNEFYQGVPNFNPEWSDDIKKLYHLANLNQQIVC